jgi:hypothetical protein
MIPKLGFFTAARPEPLLVNSRWGWLYINGLIKAPINCLSNIKQSKTNNEGQTTACLAAPAKIIIAHYRSRVDFASLFVSSAAFAQLLSQEVISLGASNPQKTRGVKMKKYFLIPLLLMLVAFVWAMFIPSVLSAPVLQLLMDQSAGYTTLAGQRPS